MKFKVVRQNTEILIDGKSIKSGEVFEAKREDVEPLLKNMYIKEVKNGKATIK